MAHTKKPGAKTQQAEVVHIRFTGPMYTTVRIAATAEHRTIANFVQLAVIEALKARNVQVPE